VKFIYLLLLFTLYANAKTPAFHIEQSKVYSIKEVQNLDFKIKENDIPNWGYSSKTFWLKIAVSDIPQDKSINTMEVRYPLDHIEFYYFEDGRYKKRISGNKYKQQISYKNTIFDLPNERSKPFYFRVKSRTAIEFTYSFWKKDELLSYINSSQFFIGIFFGFIIFSIIYTFITYFWLKDKSYLYMGIFLVLYGLFQMSMNRLSHQFLWPNSEFLNLKSIPIFAGLTYGSFLIFMSSLLDIRRTAAKLLKPIYLLLIISSAITIAPVFLNYRESMFITIIYMLLVSIFIFTIGLIKYNYSKDRLNKNVAKFFMISWFPFLIGIIFLVSKVLGIAPSNFITNYMLQLGSIISILMFVFLTGEKFKTLREQKEKSDFNAQYSSTLREKILKNNNQIVHDIKSPLSALKYYLTVTKRYVPDEQIKLGEIAFRSLEDIINNISNKNAQKENSNIYLVNEVLQDIVSAKRYEKSDKNITLRLESPSENDILFFELDLSGFTRSISNILNNSYEAGADLIDVKFKREKSNILIIITDNGHGIKQEYVDKVLEQGFTKDKVGGTGLGLSFTSEYLKRNGGSISIESSESSTAIKLLIPIAIPPKWFIESTNIVGKDIIIVDDELSIFNLWLEKLKELNVNEERIKYFNSPPTFRTWFKNNQSKQNIYFIDYEYLGFNDTGINLINDLALQKESILITSKFNDKQVLELIHKNDIKMVPKSLLETFNVINDSVDDLKVDLVLIDDDSLTRRVWETSFKADGKKIIVFESISEFLDISYLPGLNKEIPIYIDSQLGDNIRGEIDSELIWNKGFTNLHITTGSKRDDINIPKWILSVIDKSPPQV
jgi:signal transduction histidine kinase